MENWPPAISKVVVTLGSSDWYATVQFVDDVLKVGKRRGWHA
jgi:hypothetical protein